MNYINLLSRIIIGIDL